MTPRRRYLLVAYAIVAHALMALLYWQNSAMRDDLGAYRKAAGACATVAPGCPYQERIVAHLVGNFEPAAHTIYLLGDSILARMPDEALGTGVVNLGISGDTSAGLRYRIARYPFLDRARAVVIHVGVNDVLQAQDKDTVANLGAILAAVAARADDRPVPVVLSAMLPVDEAIVGRSLNAGLRVLNARFRQICEAHDACAYVDAGPALGGADAQLAAQHHTGDGIHLNNSGYAMFTRILGQALEQVTE